MLHKRYADRLDVSGGLMLEDVMQELRMLKWRGVLMQVDGPIHRLLAAGFVIVNVDI